MRRVDFIDYAKALCIIFVVFIHTGFSALNNIILFLMPVFFAATGFTFTAGKRSAWQNIKNRFKSIMIPYFIFMIIYTLIEMLRAHLFGYGDATIAFPSLANTVYGSGVMPFEGGIFDRLKEIMSYKSQPQTGVDLILPSNCHLWFLPATFTAYVIFVLTVKITRRNHPLKAAAICFLLLLAASEVAFTQLWQLPFGLGRGAIGAAFILFGFWLKEYDLLKRGSKAYFAIMNSVAALIYICALLLGSNGSALVRSVYGPYGALSVLVTFIGGCAGILLVFSLCMLPEKIPFVLPKKCISYIGKNVMTVYAWHMAVKFVFDAVYLCVLKSSDFSLLDEYKMGLMPEGSTWFMLFEAISVIAICTCFSVIRDKYKGAKIKKA